MESPKKITFIIPSCQRHVQLVGRALKGILSKMIPDADLVFLLELAVCEAVSNSVEHAHDCSPDCDVEVTLRLWPQEIVIQVTDKGARLDVELLKQKQFQAPEDPASVKEGGRGLLLINRIMDEVSYRNISDTNVLIMKKKIEQADRELEA